jgi:LPS export ABC transporter protein LptC
MIRGLYFIVPVLLAAAALFLAWQGLHAPAPDVTAEPRAEQPRYAVTGAVWVRLGRGGEPEFRAQAAQIDYYADESANLQSLVVDTLGGTASPWHLTADTGQVPAHERSMLLKGAVEARSHYGNAPFQFTTDQLWVDLLRRQLRTDSQVRLSSEFRRASARGLQADFSGERVQLLNDVQVDYDPED